MSHYDIASRWFDRVSRGEDPGRRTSQNVLYYGADALYSYGTHFALVVPLHNDDGSVRMWLLNGDSVSVTTAQHQSMVRGLAAQSSIPSMIVPFSALSAAGIYDRESIKPLEIKDDWFTEEPYTCKSWCREAQNHDGCGQTHMRQVHHLGASVFEATFPAENDGMRTERFLSAFDEQERAGGLYFLCQLPSWAPVVTYEEAIQSLKPVEVVKAEAMGEVVTRQGDIFAVPEPTLTKRELRSMGATFTKGKNAKRYEPDLRTLRGWDPMFLHNDVLAGAVNVTNALVQRYEDELWRAQRSLLHTAHTATDIAFVDEDHVYARGHLYHDPLIVQSFRERDHARRKIGDGKTWHRIVKNTVPQGQSFSPRAWTMGGRVD